MPYLHWLPPQNKKSLRSLRQKARKFMHQDIFDFVCLLDFYAYANAVDAGFDVHPLVLIPRHRQRVQEDLWGTGRFDFWDIVPFGRLRGEIGKG
jgi:hypothetical protein